MNFTTFEELRENNLKDDLKDHFQDDLAFSKKRFPFTQRR